MAELPSGTVTFVFTDIEGSTRLLRELGDGYAAALAEHRRVVREAFARRRRRGGHAGRRVLLRLRRAPRAVAAAAAARRRRSTAARSACGWASTPACRERTGEGYVGIDVHLRRAHRRLRPRRAGLLSSATAGARRRPSRCATWASTGSRTSTSRSRSSSSATGAFPPLKTISNTNLPRPASSFVGREREIARGRGARCATGRAWSR